MTNKSTAAAAKSLLGRCGTAWSRLSVVVVGLGLCAGLLETGCKVRPNNQSVRIVRKSHRPDLACCCNHSCRDGSRGGVAWRG
jgi:hypothetical protein